MPCAHSFHGLQMPLHALAMCIFPVIIDVQIEATLLFRTATKNSERSGYHVISINKPNINLNSFTFRKEKETYDCDIKFY